MEPNREWEQRRNATREEDADDHYLPTISLIHIPHPKIPNLYQGCFEYMEPWQWSPVTELVVTGQWFFGNSSGPLLENGGE
ncbi:MAG: hypothetical protein HYX73_07045 [Acidobacteria bacterium]|nr:hypothetical protein [Acidobacteriota bacterium]